MSVYVSEVGTITDENAREIARSLPYIGSGVSRTVYDLGDVVLKLDDGDARVGNCASEVACWQEFEGTEHEHLFARILAHGNGWIIAEKAPTNRGAYGSQDAVDVISQLEWLGIGDLHPGNIGMRADGTVCAIDYAFNEWRGQRCSDESAQSSEQCECGEHDCRECYPNGCECCCSLHNWSGCGSLVGCNAVECDLCYQPATVHFPQAGEWFGFAWGIVTQGWNDRGQYVGMVKFPSLEHYCAEHEPAQDEAPKQCDGQLGFAIVKDLFGSGCEMVVPYHL